MEARDRRAQLPAPGTLLRAKTFWCSDAILRLKKDDAAPSYLELSY